MHVLMVPARYPSSLKPVSGIFFRDQARALRAAGLRVGIIAPTMCSLKSRATLRPEILAQRAFVSSDTLHEMPTYRKNFAAILPFVPYGNFLLWKRTANLLLKQYIAENGKPDIIHAHCAIYAGAVVAQWAERHGYPFVVTEHSTAYQRGILRKWHINLAGKAYERADAIISVSPMLRNVIQDSFGISDAKLYVLPNVVGSRFVANKRSVKANTDSVRILNVAMMTQKKGQLDLIRAVGKLVKGSSSKPIFLTLAGDGPDRRKLEAAVKMEGLGEYVNFRGRVDPKDMPQLYGEADVVVISSHHETFGVAAAEALLSGVPVISTRCGGPESFIGKQDGILVRPADSDDLALGIETFILRRNQYRREDITARARGRFSSHTIARSLKAIYTEILAKKESYQTPQSGSIFRKNQP